MSGKGRHYSSASEVASLVAMPRLLETLGFSVNTRTHRCACLLHDGENRTTFSWTEEGLWFCFSCGTGGDRIRHVMAAKRCSFRESMNFLSAMAGVRLAVRGKSSAKTIKLIQKRRRASELAWVLRDEIVLLRGVFRDRLLRAERLQQIVGERIQAAPIPERQLYWIVLTRLAPVTSFFLAGVRFLNDANVGSLIRFVQAPHSARRRIILEGEA
jgi:hypothetical protein